MSYYNQPLSPYFPRDSYYHTSTRQPYEDYVSADVSTRSVAYRGDPLPPSPSYSSTYPTSPSSSYYSSSPRSPYLTTSQIVPPPAMTCLFPNCRYVCPRKADMERHVANTHCRQIVEMVDCQVAGCHRKGQYGFTRKDKMIDHMREVHKCDIPKKASGSFSR